MIAKKGLSQIIATVLLILLTVGAIVLLAGFVVPLINDQLRSTGCLKYRDYFVFDDAFNYNCYEPNGVINITIKTNSPNKELEKGLSGLSLILVGDGTSTVKEVLGGSAGSCSAGGVHMFGGAASCSESITLPKTGEVKTYTYTPETTGKIYQLLRVRAVITQDGETATCEESDSITLRPC